MTLLHILLPCPMCFALIIYLLGKVICDKLVAGGNKLVNAELIQSCHVRPSLAQMFCKRFRDCFADTQPQRWISCMLTWKIETVLFCMYSLDFLVFSFLHTPSIQSLSHAQHVHAHRLKVVSNLQHNIASDALLFSFKASCSIFPGTSSSFSNCTH